MTDEKQYIFGPVPSRRLGLSLGVDIVPFKVCTLDCVYCQLGRTTEKTIERKEYVPVEAVLSELKQRLTESVRPDFISLSGSGEPTLHSRFGQIIESIKKITDIPVAVLTNGTLLTDKSVRDDCCLADVVLPSLDAGDEATFQKINRPCPDISIEKLIDGLVSFRNSFSGRLWLEVFLIEGLNTSSDAISKISAAIDRIRPDKVQLNTAVRPTAEAGVTKLDYRALDSIAKKLGDNCEVIADFSTQLLGKHIETKAEHVFSMLKRRPCSLNDICSGLSINPNEALKYINSFRNQGLIIEQRKGHTLYFKAI